MEGIHKLQPHRTIHLRGFDDRGAAAALHSATENSFKVTGVFRDPADFCVLILYDADNFFEHRRLKYLPDFDFSGIVLEFDVRYSGLQPLDSAKYPTIDWPYLDVIRPDGSTAQVRLFDHATPSGGTYTQAETTIAVQASAVQAFDRVTIWYQNYAFDYIASGGETAEEVAAALAAQINDTDWQGGQAIEAGASGANITIRAARPGADGNMITVYTQSKTDSLRLTPDVAQLAGGSSDATWHVRLDFSALGIDQIRQAWLTFAPALANGAAYEATEWEAEFTNWTVTGEKQWLLVAGPGSVRIEETDRWCDYSGNSWSSESGFYSKGFARRASEPGDSVTIRYHCQFEHDLWLGTSLYTDRGRWKVSVDGDDETVLDCYLNNEPQVNTRRRLRTALPAGRHTVRLEVDSEKNPASSGTCCYFDFLEAVVPSDVPEPDETVPWSPALDYDTDHGYKLSPARLMWILDKLGYEGALNLYVGVFWWNQRKREGHAIPQAAIDFAGSWQEGDQLFIDISGQVFGKTVFPADTAESIAAHFAYFINEESVGVWAQAAGSVLTITNRAVGSAYQFTLEAWWERGDPPVRTDLTVSGSLSGGELGVWMIDPEQDPPINVAAAAWLKDLLSECAARGREIVLAYSMELLNPPMDWASRFPDGTPVQTATGFADNKTTHCSFRSEVLEYQKRVYAQTAQLMQDAGVPVWLQFGEFLWWFFSDHGGMAYYDSATQAAAQVVLGRPLHVFTDPDDDPSVNGYADADLLRDLLDGYVAALRDHVKGLYPEAQFEILLALDVNYERPVGRYSLGGRLNHYVNIPESWRDPATAPFDRVKMEALDFGAGTRSLDLAREAIRWPYAQARWPKSKTLYNLPLFNGGCPWKAELQAALDEEVAGLVLWAFDHVCLFGWPLRRSAGGAIMYW